MNAGRLKFRVTLEKPPRRANEFGEIELVGNWIPVRDLWADIRPSTAREIEQAAQVQQQTTHQVRLRYSELVTPQCRLNWGGRILAIVGVVNVDEANFELRLSCNEVQNGQ